MEIHRNDPCICGSGKKYKKCCLHKENVVQLQEVRVERFKQQKHALVLKLNDFIQNKFSFNEYAQIEASFTNRTKRRIPDAYKRPYFQFWLHFFHTYDNNLRGVEWYYEENQTKLPETDRKMLETWISLRPQLVQAIEFYKDEVIFEDRFTKETYNVVKTEENLVKPSPWTSTIALLESCNNQYYFNGVKVFSDPQAAKNAEEKIVQLVEETKLPVTDVMVHYFPEILAEFLNEQLFLSSEMKQKTFTEYKVQYRVTDQTAAEDFLKSQQQFVTDKAEGSEKRFTWIENWYVYEDSQIDENVQLGEVLGLLSLKDQTLIFTSTCKGKFAEFQQLIKNNLEVVSEKEDENSITVPFNAEVKNFVVGLSKNLPQYVALYAQNTMHINVDEQIPMYENLSIRQLVETGRVIEAEAWLRKSEYDLYNQIQKQFGQVEFTADFNTVRKEVGLPLSPFVTGGDDRVTQITDYQLEQQQGFKVVKEDIPFLEAIGFTPANVNTFFTADFLAFFKEKAVGKSEYTVRKYRDSLYDLRLLLEKAVEVKSWSDVTYSFLERIFVKDYFDLFASMSKTQVKDFISAMKAFMKWIDSKHKTTISKYVQEIIHKFEQDIVLAVVLKNQIPTDHNEATNVESGLFVIKDEGTLSSIGKTSGSYLVDLADVEAKDFILSAKLKESDGKWKISWVDHVYPPVAKQYL